MEEMKKGILLAVAAALMITPAAALGPNEAAALALDVIVILLALVAAELLLFRPLAKAARRLSL
jgi:hypothetical protein